MFSYAALIENKEVFELLKDNLPHGEESAYLHEKDVYGKTGKDYIQMRNWEL